MSSHPSLSDTRQSRIPWGEPDDEEEEVKEMRSSPIPAGRPTTHCYAEGARVLPARSNHFVPAGATTEEAEA